MKTINLFIKKILPVLLIACGFIYCMLFIYFKLLRELLPKDIPINLVEFSCYCLLFLLSTYVFIIYRQIYPKVPHPFILKLINFITLPFIHFDAFLKYNHVIYPYYYKLFCYVGMIDRRSHIFNNIKLYEIMLNILPRILLLAIFFIDVIWLHKIAIFYYFISISILPLFYRYINYSIDFALEAYIKQLEDNYKKVLLLEEGNLRLNDMYISDEEEVQEFLGLHNPNAKYHDEIVSIRKYIEIQAEMFLNYDKIKEHYTYVGTPYATEAFVAEYCMLSNKKVTQLIDIDFKVIEALFNNLEGKVITLFIYVNKRKVLQEHNDIKFLKLAIYVMYFIVWLYVFIISISTLKDISWTMSIMDKITLALHHTEDPFSSMILWNTSDMGESFRLLTMLKSFIMKIITGF